MEISWYGHTCFQLSQRGLATIVTDPYDPAVVGYPPLNLKADVVTVSRAHPAHNTLSSVQGTPYVIQGPGEYEIGGVFITGVATNGHTKSHPEEPRNTLYVFSYEGLNVVHLGLINRVPSQAEVEALGPVHVALAPVGGGDGLNAARAAEVISLLDARIVIPMYFATPNTMLQLDPLSKFLKEMGLVEVENLTSLKVTSNSLPEQTRVIVLEHPL